MSITTPTAKFTYDDYLLFPNDGKRYELIEGDRFVTPAPEQNINEFQAISMDCCLIPFGRPRMECFFRLPRMLYYPTSISCNRICCLCLGHGLPSLPKSIFKAHQTLLLRFCQSRPDEQTRSSNESSMNSMVCMNIGSSTLKSKQSKFIAQRSKAFSNPSNSPSKLMIV